VNSRMQFWIICFHTAIASKNSKNDGGAETLNDFLPKKVNGWIELL
jgi:hypothetical protein